MKRTIQRYSLRLLALLALWLSVGLACTPVPAVCDDTRPCPSTQTCQAGFCACPEAMARCGAQCVDLLSDPGHCGACAQPCKTGWRCLQGTCLCEQGLQACGDACIQISNNPLHCGQCGRACAKDQRCVQGQCQSTCPADAATECAGTCADTSSDPAHCGGCGKACASTEICLAGQCSCPPGWRACPSQDGKTTHCVDPMSHPAHCGKCNNQCKQHCASGQCVTACPQDTPTLCFGGCFDTQTNRNHCGGCGQLCRQDQACIDGQCACPPGHIACNGRCVDLRTSFEHCGACGFSCQSGQSCEQGQCLSACPAASPARCFGGCYDLQTHPQHCGKCGNPCQQGQVCTKGVCTCPAGLLLCDGQCIDPTHHPIHCGACNQPCADGKVCAAGVCDSKCPAGAPAQCTGGCHDPKTSLDHCGKCGNPCLGGQRCQSASDKTPQCQCPDSQTLCQHACVDTQEDRLHCGACGQICPAGQACDKGVCGLACGDLTACGNLCANTQTDSNHCGACNNACTEGLRCIQGQCQCPPGRILCGNSCVDPNTNRLHCGACQTQCSNSQVCEQGACQIICQDNTLHVCQDLCVELNTDPAHCGKCDNQCGAAQICQQGQCTCPSNQTQCQQQCVNLAINPDHCGKCGNPCTAGQYCDEGKCKLCSAAAPITCGTTCCTQSNACCGDQCTNPQIDANHCGKCGNQCGSGQICQSGQCVCKPGLTRACYTGPAGTRNKGICTDGTQTCNAGKWGTCTSEVTPTTEVCDDKDNNCDGQVDETFPTKGTACSVGQGACQRSGRWSCTPDGKNVSCSATAAAPSAEICDNIDNDCNGQIDEKLTRSCYTGPAGTSGVAPCKAGSQTCSAGKWSPCSGEVIPQAEICDGKDNDCDGQIDEGCACTNGQTRPCGNDVGECKKGTQSCTTGTWDTCVGGNGPTKEICDGKDNDCNGQIDEGLTPPPCPLQRGVCQGATQRCAANSKGVTQWLPCTSADYSAHNNQYQATETRCDNLDNDCDGQTDEALTQACYTGPAGTRNKGICTDGTQTCNAGKWGICSGETKPTKEICDNLDNDCDGTIDEGLTRNCYSGPANTSGVGLCKDGTETCSAGKWSSCVGQVTPATEICDNKDNDCDGSIDERLTKNCYTGPANTSGVGICKSGTQTCGAGSWGKCVGEVVPRTETCDGTDDDCDGQIDEGCQCTNGQTRACGSDIGECKKGTQTCSSGAWSTCVGEVKPTTETCDNKDNNCDGQIDEGLTQTCYTGPANTSGVGLCKDGTQTCNAGSWGSCVGEVTPTTETCDGKDNDCDGSIDESLTRSCYSGPANTSGVGLCKKGTETCSAGSWSSCVGEVVPTAEICDNKDNNCDGSIDEKLTQSCYSGPKGTSGIGICRAGTQTCGAGNWGKCVGEVTPQKETCDGKDDDCDGQIDEGCQCTNGQTRACGSNVGECRQGLQTCTNGAWGSCVGEITPRSEICDNKDNDCDGSIDEGLTQTCYTGPTGTSGVGQCKTGTQTCNAGSWGKCAGQIIPTTEICNNLDDNCDGQIDENLQRACYSGPTGTNGTGICRAGTQICRTGSWGSCVGEVIPTTEICDGKDNDCDGQIDEGCQCSDGQTRACGSNVGECRQGLQTCRSGAWGSCIGEVKPVPETCDGKDNDCDGKIDNGCQCTDGQTRPCGSSIGECKPGLQTCRNGAWNTCSGGQEPIPEICDGKDNDCDGKVDNNCNPNPK